MADFYGAANGGSLWPDAQNGAPLPTPSAEDREIAADASRMPMVQPIIVVPYSAQMQPLSNYNPNGFGYGGAAEDEFIEDAPAPARVRKANASAIIALLLGIVTVAVIVVGHFVASLSMLNFTKNDSAVKLVLGLIDTFKAGNIDIKAILTPIGVAVGALFAALTLITNLFSVKAARYPIVGKIFAFLSFAGMALALIMLFVNKLEIGIGAYIITGLTAVIMIICLTGRRKLKV